MVGFSFVPGQHNCYPAKILNPYQTPTTNVANTATRVPIMKHILAASPSLVPIATLFSVVLVVFLEREIDNRGGVLGSSSSLMSILFDFSAVLIIGSVVWVPLGFVFSIFYSKYLPSAKHRVIYPLIFAFWCMLCILFAVLDPDGMMTYYLD